MELAIDISTRSLSLANARACLLASAMAYDLSPDICDPSTDTNVLIRDLGNCILVAFRGTKSLENFIMDANALRMGLVYDRQPYAVHRGFNICAEAIYPKLIAKLRAFGWSNAKPLVLAGHSLGGAQAVITAFKLATFYGFPIANVYTFGQPRVGDKNFARLCNQLFGQVHFRFEDDVDAITRIPGWLIGYRHSGHNIFLPSFGGYETDPVLWSKILSDSFAVWQSRRAGLVAVAELIADHHVSKYQTKLDALV